MMVDVHAHDEGETLVIAMTRPSMLGGLTLTSIGISVFIPGMGAMVTRSIFFFGLIPVFLFISYLVCLKDVYLFGIVGAYSHVKACVNKRHWGCRSYAPR
ncbi:VirB3 family type IV secretion system protein [Glaciimonas sp. CA11.2]|uniref:VirB3 family type IV secretion system protein n=1 Tax=Glaciimonas sp. CA11.2 TaxID=3048601 RepID=UPI002AB476BB|nr:VirB3 family type IV secretion system protein [Glaciimonas sp. CA11.2]MDY7549206.1 VirB3 family type IV secretion system protein [Glaciimonas sp. CA11.2]MEB0161527.1 VirB3 family type IV secretion system protein [Glaciimonas sp. CA11.2]